MRPVKPGAGQQADRAPVQAGMHPVAVEFDFVEPVWPVRRLVHQPGELRFDPAGERRCMRLPDGETGIRKTWIRFLQQVLADNPAIEVASDVPPFKFTRRPVIARKVGSSLVRRAASANRSRRRGYGAAGSGARP